MVRQLLPLTWLAAFAFALRLAVGLLLPNLYYPDELFQSLEQAHRLLYGSGLIPWEFREGARSWLLPGLLAPVMAVTEAGGAGAAGYLTGIAVVLAALGALPVAAAYSWGAAQGGRLAGGVAALGVAVWFELLYFTPKALAEVIAAHLLVLGLWLLADSRLRPPTAPDPDDQPRAWLRLPWRWLAAGSCLGLVVALRLHLAPAVLLALGWSTVRTRRASLRWLLLGLLPPLLGSGLLDAYTWGVPFGSYVRNLTANLVEGRAEAYGVRPFTFYFTTWGQVWGWAGVPLLLLAAWGGKRQPLLLAVALLVLLTHLALPLKQYRYLYPALLLLIVLAGLGSWELVVWLRARVGTRLPEVGLVVVLALGWCGTSLERAVGFSPARTGSLAGQLPPEALARPHWLLFRSGRHAFLDAGQDESICGIGLVRLSWIYTGGYTYLHRPLPLFEAATEPELRQLLPHANLLLSSLVQERLGPYQRTRCWDDLCEYRRPGGCEPWTGPDLNQRLQERDE